MRRIHAGRVLSKDRTKTLLKECAAGKCTGLLQEAANQAEPSLSKWLIASITEGASFDRMATRWELGEAEAIPCSRNSFYAYRRLTLAILDNMLMGKEAGQDGKL